MSLQDEEAPADSSTGGAMVGATGGSGTGLGNDGSGGLPEATGGTSSSGGESGSGAAAPSSGGDTSATGGADASTGGADTSSGGTGGDATGGMTASGGDAGTGGTNGEPATDGLVAEYTFSGSGSTVVDTSGFGEPLNLGMFGASASRVDGGVRFAQPPGGQAGGIVRSAGPATKVLDAIIEANAFSVEVWMHPSAPLQSGPGRIVSLDYTNYEKTNLNLMHGPQDCGDYQADAYFQIRMGGSSNACPALPTPDSPNVSGNLQHVVLTQDGAQWVLYVDGSVSASGTHSRTPSQWNTDTVLALGNLPDASSDDPGATDGGDFRYWVGDLFYVAFYDKALSGDDVATNVGISHGER